MWLSAWPAGVSAIQIDVASTFESGLPRIGEAGQEFAAKIERVSNGGLRLTVHESDELIPAAETVNAVSDGRIEAAWAGAGWFASTDSAFNMFTALPFGPDMGEYLAWMYHGGGLNLARAMFHARCVPNIPCAIILPEASGWFRKEIRSVEDLRGLRMRSFGLGRGSCRKSV